MAARLILAFGFVVAPAEGETIYAVTGSAGSSDDELSLLRFDSESPSVIESRVPIPGVGHPRVTIEFDLATHDLYGFSTYYSCQILCPSMPFYAYRIDPFTGNAWIPDWPEYPVFQVSGSDADIDPETREIRLHGYEDRNYRFRLTDLELFTDEPFESSTALYFAGIAQVPPGAGPLAGETYAIIQPGESFELVRLGGPQGSPPASTGEMTLIGELSGADVHPAGFDISESGVAYFASSNRLYRLDLASAVAQDLGAIGTDPDLDISGIAVAPIGMQPLIVAIPSVDSTGVVLLTIFLVAVALQRIGARR